MRTHSGCAIRARVLLSLSVSFAAALTACGGGDSDPSSDTAVASSVDSTALALAKRTIPTHLPKSNQPAPAPAPAPATGTMTVSWAAPTTSADGLALGDLSGFRVYYGTASGNFTSSVDVPSGTTLSATISGLPTAIYYVVVKAYDSSGNESNASGQVSLAVR